MKFGKNKFYNSRDGSIRRRGSYSVGYSEALQKGLIPDNKTSRKKYGELLDKQNLLNGIMDQQEVK